MIVLNISSFSATYHGLYRNTDKSTMAKELEDVLVRLDLSLRFVFDLRSHQGELLLGFVRMQILADPDEFNPRLFNFAYSDEMTGRVRHEGA